MADKKLEKWIIARKRHKLSDKHVLMASIRRSSVSMVVKSNRIAFYRDTAIAR